MGFSFTFINMTAVKEAVHTATVAINDFFLRFLFDVLFLFAISCLCSLSPFGNHEKVNKLLEEIDALKFEVKSLKKREEIHFNNEDKMIELRDALQSRIETLEASQATLSTECDCLRQSLDKNTIDRDGYVKATAEKNKQLSGLRAQLAAANDKLEAKTRLARDLLREKSRQSTIEDSSAQRKIEALELNCKQLAGQFDAEIQAINEAAETKVKAASDEAGISAALLAELRQQLQASQAQLEIANGNAAAWEKRAGFIETEAKAHADMRVQQIVRMAEMGREKFMKDADRQLWEETESLRRQYHAELQNSKQAADSREAHLKMQVDQLQYEVKDLQSQQRQQQQIPQPTQFIQQNNGTNDASSTELLENKIKLLTTSLGEKSMQVFNLEVKCNDEKTKLRNQIAMLQEQNKRARNKIQEVKDDSECKGEELLEFAEKSEKQRTEIRELNAKLAKLHKEYSVSEQMEARQRSEIAELTKQLEQKNQFDNDLLDAAGDMEDDEDDEDQDAEGVSDPEFA